MPRTKESDDEGEIKTGRRSKAVIGFNTVDSPLRRSTRNRQQVNREVSPDGVNVTSGPVTRTTRRKAASQEVFIAESTRTLRSRKTSFTSDTSENYDLETADFKRTTRKSMTISTTSDTPTSIRLRRSARAGSESKTIQSPAKTNRLIRASSLDLEERDNVNLPHLQEPHNSTPIKLRRRASILPSEPVLIEEVEKDHSFQDSSQSIIEDARKEKVINGTEDENKTVDDSKSSIHSPVSRLNRDFTPEIKIDTDHSNRNADGIVISPIKSSGNNLQSIFEEINDLKLKEDSAISNKSKSQIHEIIQTPKVIVEKMKFPFDDHISKSLDVNPTNRENEKFNVTIPTKKKEILKSKEMSTQRKSLTTTSSEKILIVARLNKTIDDKMLAINAKSSNKFLPISQKSLQIRPDIEIMNENVSPVKFDPKDKSILITEEVEKLHDDVENLKNVSMQQELHLNNTSSELSIDDDHKMCKESNLEKEYFLEKNTKSIIVVDEEETDCLKKKSPLSDEISDVVPSMVELENSCKEYELSSLVFEEVNTTLDKPKPIESEKKIIMENNFEDALSVHNVTSSSKDMEENNDKPNKSINGESDYDLNQLFKDIPADEWNEEHIQPSKNDDFMVKDLTLKITKQENIVDDERKGKNFEKESVENLELLLVDKKAWDAAEIDRLKIKEAYNFISSETIEKCTKIQTLIDPPASPSFEEPMDIERNQIETEAERVSEKVKNPLDNDEQVLNNNIEQEHEQKNMSDSNKFNSLKKDVKFKSIIPINVVSTTSSNSLLANNTDLIKNSSDSLLSEIETSKVTRSNAQKSLNAFVKLNDITTDDNKEDTKDVKKREKEQILNILKDINKSPTQIISETTEDKLHKTPHKKTMTSNIISQANSDLDKKSTDSENENDDPTITLPAFLYGESSDSSNRQENDSCDTDSDVAREYNLNGDSTLEYSDDNVSGDLCNASETESTESDNEDDDMVDFIVDDDEETGGEMDSDDDESESEGNKSDSDNQEKKTVYDNKNQKNQLAEENGGNDKINNKLEENKAFDKTIKLEENELNTFQFLESTRKEKLKQLKVITKNSFHADSSLIAGKLPTSSFNKSMLPSCTTSPETLLLMKEKLNDTLSALKLEQSDKKGSLLYFIEKNDDHGKDFDSNKCVKVGISGQSIDKNFERKIRKKKQKKPIECKQHGFEVEDISTELYELPKLSKTINKEKNKKKALKENNSPNLNVISEIKKGEKEPKSVEKKKTKERLIPKKEISQVSLKKTNMKKDSNKNSVPSKRMRRLSSETYFTAEEVEIDCAQSFENRQKSNKSDSNLRQFKNPEMEKSSNIQPLLMTRNKIKQLPDDIIEGLLDVPVNPKKKRKLGDQKILPSRRMFDSEHPKPDNINIEDNEYIPLSSSGGTTSFYVMNLEKPKKLKKLAAVYSFRERMLKRNQHQPVSAYLMYQEKLKASKNDKY